MIHPLLEKLFATAVKNGGSDIHIKPNSSPRIRINGKLAKVSEVSPLPSTEVREMVFSTMNDLQREEFEKVQELDYACAIEGVGRFRMNAYCSLGAVGLVARVVNSEPIPLEKLGVPDAVTTLANESNGMILVTGATGSGKSTTLAGMIDFINKTKRVNIITIEDPVEYLYRDEMGLVVQRELYTDTTSMQSALRAALREDPDVILIGEMRDAETVETAMHAAETGHLVLSTLHTTTAPGTINRIVDFFPGEQHEQVRNSLRGILRGVICQRLVPSVDNGRAAVLEIMLNQGRIPEAITTPGKYDIHKVMTESRAMGMQTFEDHLMELVRNRVITPDVALRSTNKTHALRLRLSAEKLG